MAPTVNVTAVSCAAATTGERLAAAKAAAMSDFFILYSILREEMRLHSLELPRVERGARKVVHNGLSGREAGLPFKACLRANIATIANGWTCVLYT